VYCSSLQDEKVALQLMAVVLLLLVLLLLLVVM
jgi:hypothetical protein